MKDTKLQKIYNKFQKMDGLNGIDEYVNFSKSTIEYDDIIALYSDFLDHLIDNIIDFNIDYLNDYIMEFSDNKTDDFYSDIADWIGNNWQRLYIIEHCKDEGVITGDEDIFKQLQIAQQEEMNLILYSFSYWIGEQYKEHEEEEGKGDNENDKHEKNGKNS